MIKDAIAKHCKMAPGAFQAVSQTIEKGARSLSGRFGFNRKFKVIIHCVLKLLFASDVPLCSLHRSVAEEKLNLFQFASTTVAEACACATQIVGCQIADAGLPSAPFHRIPHYVSCHAGILSHSALQNSP